MALERDNLFSAVIKPFLVKYNLTQSDFEDLICYPSFVRKILAGMAITAATFQLVLSAIAFFEFEKRYEQWAGA